MTAIRNPLQVEIQFTTPVTSDDASVWESVVMECDHVTVAEGTLTVYYHEVHGKTTFMLQRGWPLWRVREWYAYPKAMGGKDGDS